MTVSKEVRGGLETLNLPFVGVFIPDVLREPITGEPNPTDEQDIAYNAECTRLIVEKLIAKRAENAERVAALEAGVGSLSLEGRAQAIELFSGPPMIRTRYPKDDFDSEDVVTLDRDDNVVVLDAGTR